MKVVVRSDDNWIGISNVNGTLHGEGEKEERKRDSKNQNQKKHGRCSRSLNENLVKNEESNPNAEHHLGRLVKVSMT